MDIDLHIGCSLKQTTKLTEERNLGFRNSLHSDHFLSILHHNTLLKKHRSILFGKLHDCPVLAKLLHIIPSLS